LKSFDYIDATLKSWGMAVERYSTICLVSLPGAASLTLSDSGEALTCITHSFSTTTGPQGVEAEIVYVGSGNEAGYDGVDARGKFVLAEGLAGPPKVGPSEAHGAAGVINISGDEIHEMIISPVWGSPTTDTIDRLPTLPHVSIDTATGQRIKEMLKSGPVRARITTEVDTGWRPLPTLVATIAASAPTDEYVMFSGHVDSWYYGAMDNGSANASMMEVGRVINQHRDTIRRNVKLAFWSGHSHARYGTSTWYADEFWLDLHDHCVAHVNIDGPGAINATVLSEAPTMAEAHGLARDLIEALTDQDLEYRRIGRMGDQSFWGVGLPSFYCGISSQAPASEAQTDFSAGISGGRPRRGGSAWWWHTADDTLDKIEPAYLARDAQILLATVHRLAADQVLPFDQSHAAQEIRDALGEIAASAGDDLDLSGVMADADALIAAATRFQQRCGQPSTEAQAEALNACQMRLSRLLIPINYTESGPYEQDLALGSKPVPSLRAAGRLAELPDDQRHPLRIKLQRERNRVQHALRQATASIEVTLAATA
ncbi:MAG TPA: M28 family peptidase, partial [Nitrolancea sp.]|nr:M28 family peptidase [Nitrolancea sp.]